jgi:leader peptidase (prepilin peptidase)/N-methyltransferase
LIALTAIDLDTQLLARLDHPAAALARPAFNLSAPTPTCHSAVVGAMAGYLALWSVFWLFKLATGKEGHGLWRLQAARRARCLARLADAAGDHPAFIRGRRRRRHRLIVASPGTGGTFPIPFGPYLAAAGVIALFWGPQSPKPISACIGLKLLPST